MNDLLSIIQETGDPNPASLAEILGCPVKEVEAEMQRLKKNGSLLGWVPLLNLPSKKVAGEVCHRGQDQSRA